MRISDMRRATVALRCFAVPLSYLWWKQVRLGGAEERFAFRRAVSRLHEMQTDVYLARRAR